MLIVQFEECSELGGNVTVPQQTLSLKTDSLQCRLITQLFKCAQRLMSSPKLLLAAKDEKKNLQRRLSTPLSSLAATVLFHIWALDRHPDTTNNLQNKIQRGQDFSFELVLLKLSNGQTSKEENERLKHGYNIRDRATIAMLQNVAGMRLARQANLLERDFYMFMLCFQIFVWPIST